MRELIVLLLAACLRAPAPPEPAMSAAWSIYDGETLILIVRDEPGPLTSTASPPPGMRPVMHPFLSAAACEAGHESQLREILEQATSTADFLADLRAAGFRVEER